MLAACGPFGEFGPWHVRHRSLAGLTRSALLPVPCTSWQLKQVTPRVYITLCTKSFPCIRFLCAVPSAKCVNVVSPSLCSSSSQKSDSLRPTRKPTGQSYTLPSIDFTSGCPCECHCTLTSTPTVV